MASFRLSHVVLVLSLIAAFVGVLLTQPRLLESTFRCAQPDISASCHEYDAFDKPHHASWTSWFYPNVKSKVEVATNGLGAGAMGSRPTDWNLFYHLGGVGPWVEKNIDVIEGGISPPDGCEVEQIHMMARHAERYPTKKVGKRIKNLVERMQNSGLEFKHELAFFNDWELFWTHDSQIEKLTSTGPFAGTLSAFTTGVRLRTRYQQLLSRAQYQFPVTRFWASDSQRVIDTARYFATGFFGYDWQKIADLEIISEASSLGADTLTPGDTCLAYVEDVEGGHDNGYTMLDQFRPIYLDGTMKRILANNPGLELTHDDVYAMQEMCGFETTVRGSSPWCHVFTQEDFLGFEYARDILHYYRAGPGTKYSAAMGWLWLNATVNLMLQGPEAGPLFFSFVHDGDIAPMITALGILTDDEHLPVTHIKHDRKWRKSQVSPMGGRSIFEVMSCKVKDKDKVSRFVRLNINDGITVIPDCDEGPGKSCALDKFVRRTRRMGEEFGDFREKCGLDQEAADRITFLHQ
ncbi:phosphoglycerate mutase-like protein [Periconia macrospinosa]|uniref:Phosphoglycerate mutase-like protein n=1 Tax=Periconia macrospinosa TaxID=97972 RepID=A0A2V1E8N6_9PLEO|nr:phosphoglycerate mutase-like protein [Periconia macrospinosa]